MPMILLNHFSVLKKQLLFCIAIFIYVLLNSCKLFTKDEHPEYFQPIITKLQDTDRTHKESLIAFMDSAFYAFSNPGPADKIERYKIKVDFYQEIKKDYPKALLFIDSILRLTEGKLNKEKFILYRTRALYNKGEIYMLLRNYDEALHYFVLSKQTGAQYLKNDCSYLAYNGIADLLFKQGKYLLAANHYRESFYLEERCDKDRVLKFAYMQGNLNSIASCYESAGMLDSARYYYDSALHFVTDNEKDYPDKKTYIQNAKGVIYYGQGCVFAKTNELEKAKELYLKSIANTKDDYKSFTLTTILSLAALYVQTDELTKADELIKEAKASVQEYGDDISFQRLYKVQYDYYTKTGNKNIAFDFLKKYIVNKDSVEAKKKKFISMDVNHEFENREHKLVNDMLKKENQVKSSQLTAAILIAMLAIVIVLFVWYNLRHSARHVHELQDLNAEIYLKNSELRNAFESLEQSHMENTRITMAIAHDLKNPIGGIQTLTQTLLRKEQTPDSKEMLELIQNTCKESITFINDILAQRSAPAEIKKEKVDIKKLLGYCVELLQTKADEKNQQLLLDADAVTALLDRQKIWRVTSNLLHNAIKFSPPNTNINISLKEHLNNILLSVEDKGIGIPEDIQDKIFIQQPEAARTGTAGEESHGLGLYISRKIVEEHNGRLWFESKEGKGSTFYVELPLAG